MRPPAIPGAGRLPGDGNMPKLPSIDQLLIKDSPIDRRAQSLPIKAGLQLALNTRGRTDGVHFITLSYSVPEPGRQAGGAASPRTRPTGPTPASSSWRRPPRPARRRRRWSIEQVKRDKSVLDWVKGDVDAAAGPPGRPSRG